MGKQSLIIWVDHMTFKEGIFTWVKNTCELLRDTYDITLLSNMFRPDIKQELFSLVNIDEYDKDEIYNTDLLLISFDYFELPTNIIAKKTYTVVHCDYRAIEVEPKNKLSGEFIAVSEEAAEGFTLRYGLPCKTIESFVYPYKPRRVLELISCSRIYSVKGIKRMYEFTDMLKEYDIEYRWINFTELDRNSYKIIQGRSPEDIIHLPAIRHEKLLDYIAKSDYFVQFSEYEGYCYGIHEALNVGTPVLCTDIPIFRKIIQNGVNGYLAPFDVNQIANNIPKDFVYNEDIEGIKNKWIEAFNI